MVWFRFGCSVFFTILKIFKPFLRGLKIQFKFPVTTATIHSITTRCSRKEPAFLPDTSWASTTIKKHFLTAQLFLRSAHRYLAIPYHKPQKILRFRPFCKELWTCLKVRISDNNAMKNKLQQRWNSLTMKLWHVLVSVCLLYFPIISFTYWPSGHFVRGFTLWFEKKKILETFNT